LSKIYKCRTKHGNAKIGVKINSDKLGAHKLINKNEITRMEEFEEFEVAEPFSRPPSHHMTTHTKLVWPPFTDFSLLQLKVLIIRYWYTGNVGTNQKKGRRKFPNKLANGPLGLDGLVGRTGLATGLCGNCGGGACPWNCPAFWN